MNDATWSCPPTLSSSLPVSTPPHAGLDGHRLPRAARSRAGVFVRQLVREVTRDWMREPLHRWTRGEPVPLRLDREPGWRARVAKALGREGDGVELVVAEAETRLRRELRAARVAQRPPAPVLLGDIASGQLAPEDDPYSPGRAPTTSALLELLSDFDGLAVTLTTSGSRIVEDLDLLTRLDGKHAVTVRVPVAHEPRGTGGPLRTIEALTSRGLTVQVLALPAPGSAHPASWERLFDRVTEAGAQDVHPGWVPLSKPLLEVVERLRLEHGLPRSLPGRG